MVYPPTWGVLAPKRSVIRSRTRASSLDVALPLAPEGTSLTPTFSAERVLLVFPVGITTCTQSAVHLLVRRSCAVCG